MQGCTIPAMDDFGSKIEALEHRWMRAWIARNRADMKALSSRDLIILFGSDMPAILDRPSWLDAAETRLRCKNYRFGSVYVRKQGKVSIFAAPVELEATVDGKAAMSKSFLTSLWKRSAVRRQWQMIECVISSQTKNADLPRAISSMQLWR